MFEPLHINAAAEDFEGNDGRGRFLLLPGSRDRAASIARHFSDVRCKAHPRGHDLHLGLLDRQGKSLDVGVISTGMGCPSVDLIVSELIALGAKVLLRVGTSGSLQRHVHTGDVVVATAAVRDEGTSDAYLPREFPALASWPMLLATQRAAAQAGPDRRRGAVHFGPVHTKDSLHAREFGWGPKNEEHRQYQAYLAAAGVLASEMECAHLFVLAQLGPLAQAKSSVLAGGLVAVIGEHDAPFSQSPRVAEAVEDTIELAFDTLVELVR